MRVTVRVGPGALRDHVGGRYGTADPPVLMVRVAAPAIEGRANERLVRVLAAALGIPKSGVRIISGAAGRVKVVELDGVDPGAVERLLAR